MHRKFKFTPSAAITDRLNTYSGLSIARQFAAYQWYAGKLDAWHESRQKKDRNFRARWEYLNATSSIHNSEPDPIYGFDAPFKRLAMAFSSAGDPREGIGDFLRFCKLKTFADLSKPLIIPVAHTDEFPPRSWFELRGRQFKVSPNSCHPPATWIMSGAVQINRRGTLWKLRIEYGYIHDSSHWFYEIYQDKTETLDKFVVRANSELDSLLVPESDWMYTGSHRLAAERDWQSSYAALRTIFCDHHYQMGDWELKLADLLAGLDGPGISSRRIRLTKTRLRTLENWITESAKERKAK